MLRRRSRRELWKKGGPSRPGRPAAPGRLRSTAAASCRGVLRSRHRRRRQRSSPRAPCRTSGNSQDNPAGPPGASGTCRCIFVDAFQVGLRSRAMPHFAQTPGLSDSMPGHIGQKYFASRDGLASGLPWPPSQHECASGIGSAFASAPPQHACSFPSCGWLGVFIGSMQGFAISTPGAGLPRQ